ncbi:MAG: hypothetical protein AAFO07_17975 [Bacteroidota bacterium]
MASLSDIKIDLIKLITGITDHQKLKSIYTVLISEIDSKKEESPEDKFNLGQVEIRKEVSKNQIFKEQGNKSITFNEIQKIMTDEPWDHSVDDLLETLD